MVGLLDMPASGASLLLNAEGAFTALLAWFVFKENFDRRIALGMAAVLVGAITLSWSDDIRLAGLWPALTVLGACLAWGIDNNLIRKVSFTDATWVAMVKGLVAGTLNLSVALLLGAQFPSPLHQFATMLLGLLAYGVSLTFFVIALGHLGAARPTGAYFSVASFVGAVLAVVLGYPVTLPLTLAGTFMALGVWLHLTEHHSHSHIHELLVHEHQHEHDENHQHSHQGIDTGSASHTHWHRHAPLKNVHAHCPDAHHRHGH